MGKEAEKPRHYPSIPQRGASNRAIQQHYDVGNDFYRLWLDESMTYSAAMWGDSVTSLGDAQRRKRAYLMHLARVAGAESVLDIGCGWGSCLTDLVNEHNVGHAVGLTLSPAQIDWINTRALPRVEVRLESWEDHTPFTLYDSVLVIGALEHFARPEHTHEERIAIYRHFFRKCHAMLKPGGWLIIQTQAYLRGEYSSTSPASIVFPESDMPRLSQIVAGFDRLFELESMRNDPEDYCRTLEAWIDNFRKNREQIVATSNASLYETYSRYLVGGLKGYTRKIFMLLRISLRRVDDESYPRSEQKVT